MNKYIKALTFGSITLAVAAAPFSVMLTAAFAADTLTCQPIYGGGQTCVEQGVIRIDKKVARPGTTDDLTDNLTESDPKFSPNQDIVFRLTATNTGKTTISNIQIEDMLPQFVTHLSGGTRDKNNSKKVTFPIGELKPNQSQTVELKARVVDSSQIPGSPTDITCVVNQTSTTNPSDKDKVSKDNAQFCIQKQVLGAAQPPTTKGGKPVFPQPQVTTTPSTGPEMLALFGLIPTGLLGHFIRKKSLK